MVNRFLTATAALARRCDGNIAMMTALFLFPILIGAGMAIDFWRLNNYRSEAQSAVDAAALRAGFHLDDPDADLEALARAAFLANLRNPDGLRNMSLRAAESANGTVEVIVSARVKPYFMQVAGHPQLKVNIMSEVAPTDGRGVELVIVFDTTNSMTFGNSWTTAIGALDELLQELESHSGTDEFFVSLLPFGDRVRIGTARAGWLAAAAPAGWNGCVEPREDIDGTYLWALDDDTPSVDPFEASVPGVTGGLAARGGAYPHCPSVALTGPTSDIAAIKTAAQSLTNAGTGRFDDAMAWAWRLLSPKWSGLWGVADYPDPNDEQRRKAVIFVSDGRTEAYTWELSETRSWGYNQGSEDGFENMVYLCDRMKDDDIEIFMLRINGNNNAEDYFRQCASSPGHYETINGNSELAMAFDSLVEKFNTLRVVR